MTSDVMPDWAYEDDAECQACDGEGFTANCFEPFACIDPEGGCLDCTRRCSCNPPKGSRP
jgi:hypothetical protein